VTRRARRFVGAALSLLPLVVLVVFLVVFGQAQNDAPDRYWVQLGIEAMAVGVSVIGLNLLLGYTGLLSLGHFAFFVWGGFIGAIWSVRDWGLDPWLGFPIAFLSGMALGALLALTCCHLRGFYLTVVTLAFGLLAAAIAVVLDGLFAGRSGRAVTEPLDTNFGFIPESSFNRPYIGLYWIGAALLLVCLYLVWNLLHSRWGRAYKAIRESELAAGSSGVPTYWYKVSAFALSAGMVSLGGVLAAQQQLQVTMVGGTAIVGSSFELVIDAVIGGLGTMAGPVIGAFVFTLGLGVDVGGSSIDERLGEWQTVVLAAAVIAFTVFAPGGVAGLFHRVVAPLRRRLPPPGDEVPVVTPVPARHVPAGETILRLRGVTRSFGALAALYDVDLDVASGSVHALIGPNGSGKSTLANVVSGIYAPDNGRVLLGDRDVTGQRPHRCTVAGIARTFQTCQIWRRMTVRENVMVGAHTRTPGGLAVSLLLPVFARRWERPARDRAAGLLRFVGLSERADELAGSLAFIDQRRLEIARALAADPDLLILDEPAAGMHPGEVVELVSLLRDVQRAGITVLLIEHHMEVVSELADRVTVLSYGQVIAEGTPSEVASDPHVVEAYLGTQAAAPSRLVTASPLTTQPALLEVRDLHVRYGAATVLHGIDLTVHEGEVVALIGGNGAGKTTTLTTISGVSELLKSSRGEIAFLGERIERWPAHRIARHGLVQVPEGRRVFPELTVEENLLLGAYRRRDHHVGADLDAVYVQFPRLADRREQLAGLLSGGEQQMLAIGRALSARPRLLLLDEPSLGLSPILIDEVFEILRRLADDNVTILLVEQLATRALAFADRAYILDDGLIVRHDDARTLAADPDVRSVYLGVGATS
jgi:ABC-type branched-subunit amino acid transport system ATPase component/ABC-type branched-subunit amino acid transport system permease subunit